MQRASNRIVIDILMTPYEELIQDCSLGNLILLIAHLQAGKGANDAKAELWQKLQLCALQSYEMGKDAQQSDFFALNHQHLQLMA